MKPEQLKQAVKEYQEIYKKNFGVELSKQQATEQALSLLSLVDLFQKEEVK